MLTLARFYCSQKMKYMVKKWMRMMLSLRFKMMKKRMTSNLSSEMILLHPSQMLLYYLTRKKDDILSEETIKSILHVELLPPAVITQ